MAFLAASPVTRWALATWFNPHTGHCCERGTLQNERLDPCWLAVPPHTKHMGANWGSFLGILYFLGRFVSFSSDLFDSASNFPPVSSLTSFDGGEEVSSLPAIYALLVNNEIKTGSNSYLRYFHFSPREPLAVPNICQESRKENILGMVSLEAFHLCHRVRLIPIIHNIL